jgi:OOP family OmpA-OmpF porin
MEGGSMKITTHILLLALLLVSAGCANMSQRTKCIGASTLAGAAIGAGVGAAVGNQGDNDSGEGAAVGVAAGALVGGAVGLLICKAEEMDSDGDGVPDSRDKCPNTPIGMTVDANGCPRDSDGDNITDSLDKCPNTPKGVAVDATGCPLDTDRDGVPDSLDKCPNTPKGCKVDKNGCPIDSDGDGVPDCLDKCKNTPRGSKVDKNGCPLVGEELLIITGINFAFDSSALDKDSQALLERAVENLKRNPQMKVLIEGHTDSVGPEDYNMGLSLKRAKAVEDYIVSQGVAEERMDVKGLGESDPLASNDTPEGRAQNRRVEFVVTVK